MSDKPRFRQGDLVDIVFRKAVVEHVYDGTGRLSIVHSDQEMPYFWPDAVDVEVTVVGHEGED